MSDGIPGAKAPTTDGTDLDDRDVRALTRKCSVIPIGGDVYEVVTDSGSSYRVDVREERCTCPDAKYRDPDGGCYHLRRVRYATGRTSIPAWVSPDGVDPLLGRHTTQKPRLVASDGGANVGGASAEDGPDPGAGRPEDCDCLPTMDGPPCFACWMAGFETPNPDAEASDDD